MHKKVLKRTTLLLISLFYSQVVFSHTGQKDSDSVKVIISSSNLSEDFSMVSTKNDELFFIIFEYKDSISELRKPVFIRQFNFNPDTAFASFTWQNFQVDKQYIFFLLELDSDVSSMQLSPVLRVHYNEIIKCFNEDDYNGLEKYLGDEDVIGYGNIKIPKEYLFNKIYKLDRYSYKLIFEHPY